MAGFRNVQIVRLHRPHKVSALLSDKYTTGRITNTVQSSTTAFGDTNLAKTAEAAFSPNQHTAMCSDLPPQESQPLCAVAFYVCAVLQCGL